MNKGILKFLTIIIVSILFMVVFSVSYTSNSIDNIAYVTAIGIDISEKNEEYLKITFEFMDTSSFSSNASSESAKLIIDTVTAPSINSAISLLNSYVGKEVNLSHCKVIIFSDKLASKGISSEITELMNNIQIRPTTNLIISKSEACKYIEKSISSLEKILTKYYDIFPNSSQYTGYTSNIMIGQFYNCFINKYCGNLAILGGLNPDSTLSDDSSSSQSESNENSSSDSSSNELSSNSSSVKIAAENSNSNNVSPFSIVAGNSPVIGERGTENIGLAVFKDDKYIGDLTAMDTLCHTLIIGEVESFLLTINDPKFYKDYIDINLFENSSPHVSIDISNDIPTINIDIQLNGRILGIKNKSLIYDEESLDLDEISSSISNYLTSTISSYLNKTQHEFKCDIDDFYSFAKKNFYTIYEWNNYNWKEKYPKANFNVNIKTDVSYSLLNSD